MAKNSLEGFYDPGKPLPSNARNEIVNLFSAGLALSDISRNTRETKALRCGIAEKRCTLIWASTKPGTWNIPEHPGTSRNIPEHFGTSRNKANYHKLNEKK